MSKSQETPPPPPVLRPLRPGAHKPKARAGSRHTANAMSECSPRAPSRAEWAAMSRAQRKRVAASLPGEVTEEEWGGLPEGDLHFRAKAGALEALRYGFTEVLCRKAYVSVDLPVYYPAEQRFAPDVLVVLDAKSRRRKKWDVNWEGKELDFILNAHAGGERKEHTVRSLERYARLKVPEYFIFDCLEGVLEGYRLEESGDPEQPGRYRKLEPQGGRYSSERLGVELTAEAGRLRFYVGDTLLLEEEEQAEQLRQELQHWKAMTVEQMMEKRKAAEQKRRAAEQARNEEARRRQQAEERVSRLEEEIARLKALLH
jgi:hypothetical protein